MIICKQEKTSRYQSKQGDLKFKGHTIVRSYDLHAFQTYWDDSIHMCIAHFSLLTHRGPVENGPFLTPYWCHQILGYLKKIWMPVVNIQCCPWTLEGLNI